MDCESLTARISEVPESRLLFKSKPLADTKVQEMWLRRFDAQGVHPSRIDFSGMIQHTGGHLGVSLDSLGCFCAFYPLPCSSRMH